MKNVKNVILKIAVFFLLIFSFAYCNIQKIVEYNKPSVVLMYLDISGQITFRLPIANEMAIKELENELVKLAYSGILGNTDEEVKKNAADYIIMKIAENPLKYLKQSKRTKTVNVSTGAVGSGVIINPNGYILTATHVVALEEEEIKQIVIEKFLLSTVTEDFFTSFEQEANIQLTKNQEEMLSSAIMQYLISSIVSFNYEKKVYVGLGIAEKGKSNVTALFKPANIIKLGSSEKVSDIINMGRDIAIVKIDQTNLPVSLVSPTEPLEGAEITVIGYPAQVHFFAGSLFDNFSILKPTVTKGIVSALRTSNKGVRVIQTDATVSGGNSGGPAYNQEGKIIGTVSWGLVNPQVGVATQNYNILVSCQEIRNFLKEANIENIQTELDKNYVKGIDEYYSERYRNALRYFKKVQEIYPEHPYIREYISNCQTNIDQGKDRSGISFDGNTNIIILIGLGLLACGAGLILLAAVLIYFLVFRKKAVSTVPSNSSSSNNSNNPNNPNNPPYIRPEK